MFKSFKKIFFLHFLILFASVFLYIQLSSIFLQKELLYLIGIFFVASLLSSYLISKLIILPKDLLLANLQMDFDKFNDEIKTKNHQKNFELELFNAAIQEKLNVQREQCEVLQEKLNLEILSNEEKEQKLKEQLKLVSLGKIYSCMITNTKELILNMKEISQNINSSSIEKLKNILDDMEIKNIELEKFIIGNENKSEFYLDNSVIDAIRKLDNIFVNYDIKVDYNINKSITSYGISSEFTQVILYILDNLKNSLIEKDISSKKIFIRIKKENKFAHIIISNNAGKIQEDTLNDIFEIDFTSNISNCSFVGLFISKIIIEENMQGKFEFENLNQGSKFTIKIPVWEE